MSELLRFHVVDLSTNKAFNEMRFAAVPRPGDWINVSSPDACNSYEVVQVIFSTTVSGVEVLVVPKGSYAEARKALRASCGF